ncbi:hypothetical protein CAPTEDRAFT_150049 [Capitella teleta]|uniref:AAA+ ATPase domain-containing protein n=1 Tax=Capitella teleta TaxID=283909 RepID=R7T3G8_CAPTE|nr:hypothetical protein CAPTEDRAFT_150049 [Capitella teleta]|eukprot:ELT87302.1 hypothetical protein CAPTEDRAFT_150049 [Capitella teleta]
MASIMYFLQSSLDRYRHISWNTFENDMLLKGEVSKVIIIPNREMVCVFLQPGAIVNGRKAADPEHFYYSLKVSDVNKVEEKIRNLEKGMGIPLGQGTSITYERRSECVPVAIALISCVMLGLFVFMMKSLSSSISTFNPTNIAQTKAKYVRVDKIAKQGRGITFKDVAGLHEAKVEIMEFVDYLKRPEKFKSIGARIPKGALLLGPPGCGKTLLAKAVANEAEVPFLAMAGSDFVEMIGGLGASRVRDLFKDARENSPCIVYIDEIDAIGRSRGGQNVAEGSGEGEQTLNQLLVEMDGMGSTQGVIMLASTNRADILDKALLRPGRFDRHILIDLPTLQERRETFDLYLKKLKTASPAVNYIENLAQLSPGMSGADIANICNEAALYAARHKKKAIDVSDFDYAVERVIAGVAKKSTVLSQMEKKILAYHEAGHALVGWLLEHTDVLLKVTIVPRTSKALGFAQYMPKENVLYSKDELFDKMCMAMGGRVAESLTFNTVSQGAQDDLSRITKMAYLQIRELGMNDKVGPVSYGVENEANVKPYSMYLGQVIDEEARILIAKSYKATEKILRENKEKLRVISEALLEKECLSYKDMEELVGPPTFGKKSPLTSEWDEKKND